jgi:transcription elongation factor GreA
MTKVNYLTKEGYEKLVDELHSLKKIELPKILERLSDARSMGDLSENFEYKAALEDKDFVETRINEIEDLIHNVEIIQEESKSSKKSSDKIIDYWSTVSFFVEWDKEYTADVVWTGEAWLDGKDLKISLESPLGLAIRWKKIGDTVKMRLATGKIDVKIVNIQ